MKHWHRQDNCISTYNFFTIHRKKSFNRIKIYKAERASAKSEKT